MNQQAYGKMGVQILINLLKQFPNREFVHDLVATMINNVAANRAPRLCALVAHGYREQSCYGGGRGRRQGAHDVCAGEPR